MTNILDGITPKKLARIRHKMRMELRRIEYRQMQASHVYTPRPPGPNKFNIWGRVNDKKQPSLRRLARDRQKAENVAAKQAGL
jgi:hypothetical protein